MAANLKAGIKQYIPSRETIKQRCTSIKAWELPKQDSALAPDYVWTNKGNRDGFGVPKRIALTACRYGPCAA